MGHRLNVQVISGNSPDTVTTAVVGNEVAGLLQYESFQIVAELDADGANGALEFCLQFHMGHDADGVEIDKWVDWIRFPSVADGTTAVYVVNTTEALNAITAAGVSTSAAPAIVLAANNNLGGHPGNRVRLVCTAGSGNDTAQAQTVTIRGHRARN